MSEFRLGAELSERVNKEPIRRRRRADAERSIAAIQAAAMKMLEARPDASIEELAKEAGVARQTVYAHFESRDALVEAVVQRALGETLAAIDAAELEQGSAAEALARLIAASWQTLERYPVLIELRAPMSAEAEYELHRPILDRLEQLVRRGQRTGEFDPDLPPSWLLAAFLSLAHAAAGEVRAGRMDAEEAGEALRITVQRVFGAAA